MPKPSSHSGPSRSSTPSSDSAAGLSRRDFGRRAILAAALPFAPPGALEATPPSAASAGSYDQSKEAGEQKSDPEVEAKLANIVRKFGSRLSQEQREHLRRILAYNERMLASVRAFPVRNGDPPASVLRVSFTKDAAAAASHPSADGEQSWALEGTQREMS